MAKVNVAKVKDEAAKHLRRGKFDKALESYEILEKASPNDLKIPQKIAEILLKLGQKDKAVEKYKDSAKKYYDKGFLIQAIAIYKVILEESPDEAEVKAELNKLMEERTGGPVDASPGIPLIKKTVRPVSAPAPKPEAAPSPKPTDSPAEEEEEAAEAEQATPLDADEGEGFADEADDGDSPDAGDGDLVEEIPLGDEDEIGDEAELEDDLGGELEDEDIEVEEDAPDDVTTILPVEEEEDLPPVGPERTPLFSDLEPGEFDRVFELLESQVAPPGAVVVEEDQEGNSIFIIARGQVKVTKKDESGKKMELATLGPGDFFGEIGYFHGSRQATVTAVKRCLLLQLSKSDLDSVVEEFPRVKEVLLKFYRERVLDTLLANSPLFSFLTSEKRRHFLDRFKYREVSAGKVIVEEGSPGDSMFLIKSGGVKVQTNHPVSKEVVELARLGGGDFFGEVSLIKNKPRTATVLAESKSEILELSRNDFKVIAKDHPEIGKSLEKTIEQRVEQTIKKMMETMN